MCQMKQKYQHCWLIPLFQKCQQVNSSFFYVTWAMIGFTRYHDIWYPRGRLRGHFPLPLTPHTVFPRNQKPGIIWFHKKCIPKHPKQIAGIGSGIVFVWKHVIANWTHKQPPWNSCKKFNRTHKIQDISQNTDSPQNSEELMQLNSNGNISEHKSQNSFELMK